MGKKKIIYNKNFSLMRPQSVAVTPHPVDFTGVRSGVQTCECAATLTLADVCALTSPESTIMVCKAWVPVTCEICAQQIPIRTYDTTDVTIEKLGLIVGACEMAAAVKISGMASKLSEQSRVILDGFCSRIRKTYKNAHAKRPKEVIKQVNALLLELDYDPTLFGREVIRFNCADGFTSFSLMTATLVFA